MAERAGPVGPGDRFFVKLFRDQGLDWLSLSGITRGLYGELLLLADRSGRIRLGRLGLEVLEVPLRVPWRDLEPHVATLLDMGRIAIEGDALVVVDFERDQAKPKTDAERAKDYREGKKSPRSVTPRHGASRSKVTPRDALPEASSLPASGAEREAGPGRTFPERSSFPVAGHGPSRAVTERHVTDKTDQIRSDRPEKSSEARGQPAPGGSRTAAPPQDPNTAAILALLEAQPSLDRIANLQTAEALVSYVNGGPKKLDWVLAAIREYAAQEAIVAASSDGPTMVAKLVSGLRGFVGNARPPKGVPLSGKLSDEQILAEQARRGQQLGVERYVGKGGFVEEGAGDVE